MARRTGSHKLESAADMPAPAYYFTISRSDGRKVLRADAARSSHQLLQLTVTDGRSVWRDCFSDRDIAAMQPSGRNRADEAWVGLFKAHFDVLNTSTEIDLVAREQEGHLQVTINRLQEGSIGASAVKISCGSFRLPKVDVVRFESCGRDDHGRLTFETAFPS